METLITMHVLKSEDPHLQFLLDISKRLFNKSRLSSKYLINAKTLMLKGSLKIVSCHSGKNPALEITHPTPVLTSLGCNFLL